MSSERTRNGFIPLVLAIFSMTLLGGPAHADPVTLEAFVTDLLRSAASALFL